MDKRAQFEFKEEVRCVVPALVAVGDYNKAQGERMK
jgi:hypothetical protein